MKKKKAAKATKLVLAQERIREALLVAKINHEVMVSVSVEDLSRAVRT